MQRGTMSGNTFTPGPTPNTVRSADGRILTAHQTTGYDGMVIPRIKGKRREVRRLLARRSHEMLDGYRRGSLVPEGCLLQKALATAPLGGQPKQPGKSN